MDGEVQGVAPDLDIIQIMDLIPHRYPFLLIDRLEQIVPNESAVGIKNVTMNEPYFQGHFPGRPIMPGVLIIEAMAQTAACLVVSSLKASTGAPKLVYFMSIDEAKFRKPVTPGDRLLIHVAKERNRANVWRFKGVAKVDGQIMAEAIYTAMIVNN